MGSPANSERLADFTEYPAATARSLANQYGTTTPRRRFRHFSPGPCGRSSFDMEGAFLSLRGPWDLRRKPAVSIEIQLHGRRVPPAPRGVNLRHSCGLVQCRQGGKFPLSVAPKHDFPKFLVRGEGRQGVPS